MPATGAALFIGGPVDGQRITLREYPEVFKVAQPASAFVGWNEDFNALNISRAPTKIIEYHRMVIEVAHVQWLFYIHGIGVLNMELAIMQALFNGYKGTPKDSKLPYLLPGREVG